MTAILLLTIVVTGLCAALKYYFHWRRDCSILELKDADPQAKIDAVIRLGEAEARQTPPRKPLSISLLSLGKKHTDEHDEI